MLHYLPNLKYHYIVAPALGLAYARIPKAANSTIKRQLAVALGLPKKPDGGTYSKDAEWRKMVPTAYVMTAAQMYRRYPDIFVFTFVRDPLSRLASCYRSKIVKPAKLSLGLRREGLRKGISFPDFVRHVASRSDWRCNIHYRSQATILRHKGQVTADFVGRFETLNADWARLQTAVMERTGTELSNLPIRPETKRKPMLPSGDLFQGDQALISMAKSRYADDYRLFYPELNA
ncbi:MAG: sulfotransferase family protein [Pikeienuella sp.]